MKHIWTKALVVSLGIVMMLPMVSFNASATPSYDYLIVNNVVKDSGGNVIHTSSDMPSAITWGLSHTNKTTYIPVGTYTFSHTAEIGNYSTLINDGNIVASTTSNCHLLSANGKSHFTVNGGDWNGNENNNPYGGGDRDAFRFTSCSYALIENLNVHHCPYGNIEVDCSTNITLRNVTSHDSGIIGASEPFRGLSIILANTSNSVVENCLIYDSARGGVYFYTEDDSIVEHIDNNIMRNNTVINTQTSGLSLSIRGAGDTAINGLIENNICIDCGKDGEHPGINCGWNYQTTTRYASYCTVKNNLVYESGTLQSGGGINCQGNHCLIFNNTIHDIQDFGMLIMGDYNNASWNHITTTQTSFYSGIELNEANRCNITFNDIRNCPNGILLFNSDYNLIAYNHFQTITTYTVGLTTSDHNTIRNNSYYGNWVFHNGGTSNTATPNFYGAFIWSLTVPNTPTPIVPPVIPPVVIPIVPIVPQPIAPIIGGDSEVNFTATLPQISEWPIILIGGFTGIIILLIFGMIVEGMSGIDITRPFKKKKL